MVQKLLVSSWADGANLVLPSPYHTYFGRGQALAGLFVHICAWREGSVRKGAQGHTFSGVSKTGAGTAAGFCRAFALLFALDPRLSPRDPKASILRLRHLSWTHPQQSDY